MKKPYEIREWDVYEDKLIDNINIYDCDNTVNGFCIENLTLDECLNESKDSGYFIEYKNGRTICVPLNTYLRVNDFYWIVDQNKYPEFKETKVYSFLNRNDNPFLPKDSDKIFYLDTLNIKHNDSYMSALLKEKSEIYFDSESDNTLKIIFKPKEEWFEKIIESIPIFNNDQLSIHIDDTALSVDNTDGNLNLKHFIYVPGKKGSISFFKIIKKNSEKDSYIRYGDLFYLFDINNKVYLNVVNNKLSVSNILDSSCEFFAVSKMNAYRCNKTDCIINNDQTPAYRKCKNFCNQNELKASGQSKSYIGVIFILILILFASIYIIFKKRKYL